MKKKKKLKQNHSGMLITDLFLMTFWPAFLYNSELLAQGLGPHIQNINQENFSQAYPQPMCLVHFFNWVLPYHMTLTCVKWTNKSTRDKWFLFNMTHEHITIKWELFLSCLSPRYHVNINATIKNFSTFENPMVFQNSNTLKVQTL